MRCLHVSWILIVLFLLMIAPTQTQDETAPFRIGRGDVESVQWHPQGLYVMVSSVTGAWIYTDTLEDVTHIPDLQLADISPDGKYITGTVDGQTIQFWDALTFEFVKDYKTNVRRIGALAWSPDSRYLAVGNHGDDLFQILDFEYDPNQRSNPIVFSSSIHKDKLAWSADSRYLAMMNIETAEVRVWDMIERDYAVYGEPVTYGEYGMSLIWDRCNYLIRQQYSENPISTIWNMNNGDVIEKKYLGWHAKFSSGDCSHYSAGYIGNLATGSATEIEGDFVSYDVVAVGWKPDATQIVLSEWAYQSEPRSLWIVDAMTTSITHEIPTQAKSMREIVWHPWLSYFVTVGRDHKLTAYYLDETDTGYTITGTQDAHAQVGDVFEWNPTDSSLAIAKQTDGVSIWDVQIEVNTANYHYEDKTITNLGWSADGDNLAMLVSSGNGYQAVGEKAVILDQQSEQAQYVNVLPDTTKPVDFDWHPTESQLAIATSSKVDIFDLKSEKIEDELVPIPNLADALNPMIIQDGIRWNPDGLSIAIPIWKSGNGGSVQVYDVENHQAEYDTSNYATAWTWATDNEMITLTWGSYVDVGRPSISIDPICHHTNWDQSAPLIGMTKPIHRGFVSPNGTYGIALDEDGNGLIWELRTADVVAMLSDVKDLAWSDDDSKLAIQRHDSAIMILSPTGQVLDYLPPTVSFAPRNRYTGQFGNLKWSADGNYLAHYHDGVIDVWTLNNKTLSESGQKIPPPAIDLSDVERVMLSTLIVVSGLMGLKLIHNLRGQRALGKRKRMTHKMDT